MGEGNKITFNLQMEAKKSQGESNMYICMCMCLAIVFMCLIYYILSSPRHCWYWGDDLSYSCKIKTMCHQSTS